MILQTAVEAINITFFLLTNLLGNHLPFMNFTLITFFDNEIHNNTDQSLLLGLIRKVYRNLGFLKQICTILELMIPMSLALIYTNTWSFVKAWICFLTPKQLKHPYTSIRICLTVKIYCLNGFTHRKIWFFFCHFQY